ncbi:hypothetical protein [Mucilaginibacter sp. OK283]|uniref:hypothetical protein n=1 Tax=Mucilaginibacter sp. OK283 TaxID=1881049 RepID=UPI0008BEFE03|nr:hypothetical protein [Mucilaginibacter sp. OK283]SEP29899.1 hypothetical protein SAMN05428947_11082 [Mucilaginibacter sp. OK283]
MTFDVVMITVKLSLKQLMDAVKQLSPSKKLELSKLIWNDDMAIPLGYQNLVEDRKSKSDTNPDLLLDWETASKELIS